MSPFGGGAFGGTPFGGLGPAPAPVVVTPPTTTPGTTFSILAEVGGYGSGFTLDLTPDVTDQTRSVKRGYTSSEADDLLAAPSTFTFGLDNSASNSARTLSRYSPDAGLLPGWDIGCRIIYQVTANGETTQRFAGWIKRISITAGKYEDQTVVVTAGSWLMIAGRNPATGMVVQFGKRGDQLIAYAISLAQFPPPAVSLSVTNDPYPYAFWDMTPDSTIADAIDSAAMSGIDRVHELANGTVVLENRQFREAGATTDAFVFSDVAPSGQPFRAITGVSPYRDLDRVYSQYTVTCRPSIVDPAPVVLFDYPTTSTTTIDPYRVVQIVGQYVDPAQKAQSVAGYGMVDDSANGRPGFLPLSDYQFFDGPNGTGRDITAQIAVAVAFEGSQTTFTITGTSVTAYLYRLRVRGIGVYNYAPFSATKTSTTYIAKIATQPGKIDCKYQVNPSFCTNAAEYLTRRKSKPQTQIDQGIRVVVAAGAESDMAAILALDISSPVSASETVAGIVAGKYWINGIQEDYDARNNLTWTAFLEARDPNPYWKIGIPGFSEIGQTTFVAPI